MRELAPGFEADPDEKKLLIAGTLMPVSFSERSAPGYNYRDEYHEEACHFNILCGENGYWIELSIWPEDGAVLCERPDEFVHSWQYTAEEVIDKWKETGALRHAPEVNEYASASAGVEMGTWIGWDVDFDAPMAPEEKVKHAKFMEEVRKLLKKGRT